MYGSADEVCYPSHAQSLYDAVPHSRKELQRVDGATHYFVGRKDLVDEGAARIVEWITRTI